MALTNEEILNAVAEKTVLELVELISDSFFSLSAVIRRPNFEIGA
jgi:ribosomal protein L7/L12